MSPTGRLSGSLVAIASMLVCIGTTLAVDDGRFAEFDEQDLYPSKTQVEQLLGEVPGQKYEISEKQRRERTTTQIAGLFRLVPQWQPDRMLRIEIVDSERLRLYLWNGQSGVSIEYCRPAQNSWAVYGVTRGPGEFEPSERVLWATDGGRYRRSGTGNIDLAIRNGRLVMSRGDLELLSIPLATLPEETLFECTGTVRGIAWVPLEDELPSSATPRPATLSTQQPADLKWESELSEDCYLTAFPDGHVELSAGKKTRGGRAWSEIGPPRLREFIFEIVEPNVGTGIWFGNAQGDEICRLGFFEGRNRNDMVFALTHGRDTGSRKSFDPRRQIIPYAGQHLWFRVVLGAGTAKLWTSIDGIQWSPPNPASQWIQGGCCRLGLYTNGGDRASSVGLRAMEIRRLEAIESLASDDLRSKATDFAGLPVVAKMEKIADWDNLMTQKCPDDASPDAWATACAVATLAVGPNDRVGEALLERLVLEVASRGIEQSDLDRLLDVLGETALVYGSRDWNAGERLAGLFDHVGLTLGGQGYTRPFSLLYPVLMRSPFWQDRRLDVFSDRLLRYELFVLAGDDRWDEIEGLARRVRFWNNTPDRRDGQPPWSDHARQLIAWAAARAASFRSDSTNAMATITSPRWGDPLVTRFSKEGYNVLAEMSEALRAEAYSEACRVITGSAAATGSGLLPDEHDRRLSIALDVAIDAAIRHHPALARTMGDEFAAVGDLRLREAFAVADAEAVAAVARQFPGTDVARQAYIWLGDRELAAGQVDSALVQYGRAISRGTPDTQDGKRNEDAELGARRRLAEALLGQEAGQPIESPVEFGKRRLSVGEFERLIDELTKAHSAALPTQPNANAGFIPPGTYSLRPTARIEAQGAKFYGDRSIDWGGRQMAVLATEQQLIVNSRTDLTAVDAESGAVRWSDRHDLGDRARRWPLERMSLLAGNQRVYLRRLTESGPAFTCVGTDGKAIWTANLHGAAISDPLVVGGKLLLFSAAEVAGSTLAIALESVDPETGTVCRHVPIAAFHDVWDHQIRCQASHADGLLAATIGGAVLVCELDGQVRWVRKQVWMPPEGDYYSYNSRGWIRQVDEPPIIADGRVYATQLGVWGVECIDIESGQLVWRAPVCDIERPVGLSSGMLFLQTTHGIVALDAATGQVRWSTTVERPQQAAIDSTGELIFCCHTTRTGGNKEPWTLGFDWFDSKSGEARAQTSMTMPAGLGPLVGPVVRHGDRQWIFLCPTDQTGWHDWFLLERQP